MSIFCAREGLTCRRVLLVFLSMPCRCRHDRPMSRQGSGERFPDDGACARHLAELRRGDGFPCPACGGTKGWELKGGRRLHGCAGCGRQAPVTAGTVTRRSHLPLRTWFPAVHIVATRSNGIPAPGFRRGRGSAATEAPGRLSGSRGGRWWIRAGAS